MAFVAGIYCEKLVDSFYPHQEGTSIDKINLTVVKDEEITPAIQSEEVITADTKLIIVEHNLEIGRKCKVKAVFP